MVVIRMNEDDIDRYFEQLYYLKCHSLKKSFRENDNVEIDETCREKLLELPQYIREGKAAVFAALDGDDLVGFLWSHPRVFFNQRRLFINGLAVREEHEGKGIARSLIEELKVYARETDAAAIDLTVAPFNKKAEGFYRHLGFEDERIQMVMKL